ncbi:MAG: hypothetical protein IPJ30_12485 [Acidobacteria bacterium]|nr:hypothetical protein [Acidobacteriota bacterium]
MPLSVDFETFKESTPLIYSALNVPPLSAASRQMKLKSSIESNGNDGYVPFDNTVAASENGHMISATNSFIEFYKSGKLPIYRATLDRFVGGLIDRPCDPKIIFDPLEKKFIFFAQTCAQGAASKLVLAFSTSSDPMQAWNIYVLNGNPLNKKGQWFDYPKIGLTRGELFLSGHLYTDDRFSETAVYQIDKATGFVGGAVRHIVWTALADAPTVLQPATYSFGDPKNDDVLLVGSVWANGANYVRLYEVTGPIDTNPQLRLYKVPSDEYWFFALADQKTQTIDNGDLRMQDAALVDGKLIYTFTSGLPDRHFSRITLGVIDLTVPGLRARSKLLGDLPNASYAYPSLAVLSDANEPVSIFLMYNSASKTAFPEIRYRTCDADLACGSELILRRGESTINGEKRWGDYSGVSRIRTRKGEVWAASSFGKSGGRRTYLANLEPLTGVAEIPGEGDVSTTEALSIPFTVTTNESVQIVIKRNKESIRTFDYKKEPGKYLLQLLTEPFESGTYSVEIHVGGVLHRTQPFDRK